MTKLDPIVLDLAALAGVGPAAARAVAASLDHAAISFPEKVVAPFTVKGEEITSEQIIAAIEIMRRPHFTFMEVGGALYRAGVSWDNHDRAADRLLQRCRKLDLVTAKGGTGGWSSVQTGWMTFDVLAGAIA